jgi:hypothetical protein
MPLPLSTGRRGQTVTRGGAYALSFRSAEALCRELAARGSDDITSNVLQQNYSRRLFQGDSSRDNIQGASTDSAPMRWVPWLHLQPEYRTAQNVYSLRFISV